MMLRLNDVLIGVVTGVVVAIVAAVMEGVFVTMRFLSFGQHGGGVGSKLLLIALVGGAVGGIVGFLLASLLKPRSRA